ncbi:DUF4199 domain-containing protein [Mucilaginibacter flavus]|uniref:DUF4199 domain-containing protein n=1 Tax=Mucilaginibacter flavus TaxID=931504 RepID=UPI0025B29B92|nr:DUF4199 domain-containing protein [Mucilaginibacter flavus]MDN3582668.1 DUF4199 domain-containing protein [Mucilaginibacter flavus]
MEVKKASPSKPAIKWALIGLIASIVITYAFQFLNVDPTSSAKYINYLVFIGFLCLTQQEYRNDLGGYMTFGEGFLSGFLYSLFLGILTAVFLYVYYAILSPEMAEKILSSTQAQLEAKGTLTPEQVETAMSMTRKYFAIFAVAGAFFGSLVMGVVVALIGAAIFKKEKPPFATDVADSYDPTV